MATVTPPAAAVPPATNTSLRDREPVVFNAAIADVFRTLVLSVVTLALAFGWVDWSDSQLAAVIGVITAAFVAVSTVVAVLTRRKVRAIADSE